MKKVLFILLLAGASFGGIQKVSAMDFYEKDTLQRKRMVSSTEGDFNKKSGVLKRKTEPEIYLRNVRRCLHDDMDKAFIKQFGEFPSTINALVLFCTDTLVVNAVPVVNAPPIVDKPIHNYNIRKNPKPKKIFDL
jgi:hypothetical protein